MKLQTVKSAVRSIRCTYHSSGGRQCRLFASDAHSGLCPQHRAAQEHEQGADHFVHLIRNFQCFQTAQGINHSLGNLYELLAKDRISPRRAAVLSYISSLLLRTLPQIDADKAAGIIDPTKPPSKPPAQLSIASAPDEDADIDEDSDLDPDENADTDSETEVEMKTEAETETGTHLDSTNTWDSSIPEPDPKKKPS